MPCQIWVNLSKCWWQTPWKFQCSKWQWFNNNNNNNILWYLPINQLIIFISIQHNKHSKDQKFIEQCTSTKYNEYTTTNNVNECATTFLSRPPSGPEFPNFPNFYCFFKKLVIHFLNFRKFVLIFLYFLCLEFFVCLIYIV